MRIDDNKKQYRDLLLLADEQEDMIDRYLDRGIMYVLEDDGIKAECVVTDEGDGVLEVKNIAVAPDAQKLGYGRKLLAFIEDTYRNRYRVLRVGTGESPLTLPFYHKCGFEEADRIVDFFTNNYNHPIVECGITLKDMIILEKKLQTKCKKLFSAIDKGATQIAKRF
ncbi:MAG: GNAT family N-acetyltransferase [Clostridia bacterium]|nr:GNAT family N-acetyltransferase [Clostridia bacterium]